MPPQHRPPSFPIDAMASNDGSLHGISVAIGTLIAQVNGLQQDIVDGNEGRRRLHDKFEEHAQETAALRAEVKETNTKLDAATTKLDKITPIVEDYQSNKNKATGILLALTGVVSLVTWLLTQVGGMAWTFLTKGHL